MKTKGFLSLVCAHAIVWFIPCCELIWYTIGSLYELYKYTLHSTCSFWVKNDPFCYLCLTVILYSLVVTYCERTDLLAFLYVMFCSVFVTFPYTVSGKMWYLIVSIPDICILPYFNVHVIRGWRPNMLCGAVVLHLYLLVQTKMLWKTLFVWMPLNGTGCRHIWLLLRTAFKL